MWELYYGFYHWCAVKVLFLPSLHQKRVPPHLRLLVHLEPEEEENSSVGLLVSLAVIICTFIPPLRIFTSSSSLTPGTGLDVFSEPKPLNVSSWCNFTQTPVRWKIQVLVACLSAASSFHFKSQLTHIYILFTTHSVPSLKDWLHLVSILGCL